MNSDIRVSICFKGHRKRKKLDRLLGHPSAGYLVDLWIGAALSRPEGVLTGWTETDIEIVAGWDGEPDKFTQALISVGFIDQSEDGTLVLHDWEEHQGWACGAKKRSEAAKKAAEARWEGKAAKAGKDKK
ncbi:MAG: hypothetical protein HF981_00445 [Desulfobacteraceae bacterium]|nr:hypothetical protein [Desulfobacteraceae bacterium]MBC2748837.1 hypothetical protein [Desulfobacteraceae bacterium]